MVLEILSCLVKSLTSFLRLKEGISRQVFAMFSLCQACLCTAVCHMHQALFIICLHLLIPSDLLSVQIPWNLLGPCWWLGALLLPVMTSP